MTMTNLDTFTRAYIETALWSSTDDDGEPLDGLYSVDDIAPKALAEMIEDCESFQSMFGVFIEGREEQAGHDFWLTRNGHGAGFWDGDWSDAYTPPTDDDWHAVGEAYPTVGDYLTAMAKPYGSSDLYIGDDGLIYVA